MITRTNHKTFTVLFAFSPYSRCINFKKIILQTIQQYHGGYSDEIPRKLKLKMIR